MTEKVICFTNGPWRQNCYIVRLKGKYVIVIDPGSDEVGISRKLKELDLVPLAILNTHAHFDHIGAVMDLQEKHQIPFFLHKADEPLLRRANLYRLVFDGQTSIRVPKNYVNLESQDHLEFAGNIIDVFETPGHTPGSVTFRIDNVLFTGDTLLVGGIGRYDLPGGDKDALLNSILFYKSLSPHLTVYAGHGRPFTLSEGRFV